MDAITAAAAESSGHQDGAALGWSQFDIPALLQPTPVDFRVVAKRSFLRVPVFGRAQCLAGFIFINRSNREQAIKSPDRAAGRLRRGTSVAMFAEGARSADGTLLPFQRGGFVLMAVEG